MAHDYMKLKKLQLDERGIKILVPAKDREGEVTPPSRRSSPG